MKKLFSVVLSALLVLGLFAGCAAKENIVTTNAPEANAPAQNQETPIQEPATEPVEAPATEPIQPPVSEAAPQIAESTVPVQPPASPSNVNISSDEAKTIALNHAGFTEGDIRAYRSELDRENGKLVYEIEFISGNYEYDYYVDAANGAVLRVDKDFND